MASESSSELPASFSSLGAAAAFFTDVFALAPINALIQVWLNEFAGSSLDILVYVFWKTPDWPTELRERHRFMLDIIRLAGELEVEFAFPTRTVYLRKEDDWEHSPQKISAMKPEGWMKTAETDGREIVEEFTADDDWRKHLPPPYTFTGARDGGSGGGEGGGGEG